MPSPKQLKIGIAIAVVCIVILLIAIFVVMAFKKWGPKTGTFAGFSAKYRGIDSYQNVDPLVNFFYQNRELRKSVESGQLSIENVYIIYKSFYNNKNLQNVPMPIMKEVENLVKYMEVGKDFSSIQSPDAKTLVMGITNMDRLLTQFLESLSLTKDTVGGTNTAQEKLHNDYMSVNNISSGYVQQAMEASGVTVGASSERMASKIDSDIREEIGLQLQIGQSDVLRYMQSADEYQNKLSGDMKNTGLSAAEYYSKHDKRFPGSYERNVVLDEPITMPDKNYKNPSVPRPGIIGKIADDPYHYDVHAKNFIRSY